MPNERIPMYRESVLLEDWTKDYEQEEIHSLEKPSHRLLAQPFRLTDRDRRDDYAKKYYSIRENLTVSEVRVFDGSALHIENKSARDLEKEFQRLNEKLQETLDEVRQLRVELSQRPLASTIMIHDLGDKNLKVVLPISVVLNETDDESLARWPETRASGIGATLGEAISELKKNISYLYFDLKSRPLESLGDIALDTLNIFETHLQIAK